MLLYCLTFMLGFIVGFWFNFWKSSSCETTQEDETQPKDVPLKGVKTGW